MNDSLIDWPEAAASTRAALARPHLVEESVRTALTTAPTLQNKEFPLSPVPVLLREAAVRQWEPLLTAYTALLGKVVRLYRSDPEVRSWFALGPAADRLIYADDGPGDAPWICRLDGYLEEGTEQLTLLENNADAPAGPLFTPRINVVVEKIADEIGNRPPRLSPLTYRQTGRFLDALLVGAKTAARTTPGKQAMPQSIAVLQPEGAASQESRAMVAEFTASGFDAFLADPRGLEVRHGRARLGGRPVDLCWNKVNTVAWQEFAADDDFVFAWERALRDTPLVHLNSFGARYVAENKLALAFLQEPIFADLLEESERKLAAELLPWSRKVTPDAVAEDGVVPLVDDLLERPAEYVLKAQYDIRGDGVTIGHDVPNSTWRRGVLEAMKNGHIAQRRVRPARYPVVRAGSSRVDCMAISLDTFVFGGSVAGFGSKASVHAKVNVFQGGQKLAVHVTLAETP